jgi:hypothetical protein
MRRARSSPQREVQEEFLGGGLGETLAGLLEDILVHVGVADETADVGLDHGKRDFFHGALALRGG